MEFEWDSKKAISNQKKHGVSFEMASTVFHDLHHLSIPDSNCSDKERWITVGLAADSATLVVVHTYSYFVGKMEVIRIISARNATKKERKVYEEGI